MTDARFLMVVPYKARDLEGHSLVARQLEDAHGHEVLFSNGYALDHKLRRTPVDVLVLDHLGWDFKVRAARLTKSLGMRVAVMPTEGLLRDETTVRKQVGQNHCGVDVFDQYLCWGSFHRDALRDVVDDEAKLPVVGCPRFDFYREPLRSILPTRHELARRLGFRLPDSPLVLWATNTPYAQRTRSEVFSRYESKAKFERVAIESLYHDNCEQFRVHSQLILDLAQRRPDLNIVIKVHPAERPRPYMHLTKSLPNVVLAYDTPIRDFIPACDALVHRGCTTATEAWIVNKRVIELQAGEYDEISFPRVTGGCEIAENGRDLEELVDAAIDDPSVPQDVLRPRGEFLDRFYSGVPGDSANRTAAALATLVGGWTDDKRRTVDARCREEQARFERSAGNTLPYRTKRLLRLDPGTSLRPWNGVARRIRQKREGLVAEPPITRDLVEQVWADLDASLAKTARSNATAGD